MSIFVSITFITVCIALYCGCMFLFCKSKYVRGEEKQECEVLIVT